LTTNFTYDLLGNILTEDVPGQPSALFNYNQQDEQLKAQDSDATSSTLTFDEAGRVTSETTAGNTSSWNYDAAGHVIHRADPEDRETDYTYDWFGHTNRETETLPGTPRTTVKDTMTAYDSLGRVATITDNNRHLTHSFTYPLNTAASTTDAQTVGSSGSDQVSTNLTVGADGYETSRDSTITSNPQIPNLTRTVNTRDSGERVTKATLQTGTSRYIYAQYGYDSSGRIVRQWGPDANDGSGYLNAARTGDPT
jgi:YD repeat-containing protein